MVIDMPTINEESDDAQQRSAPPEDALHSLQDDAKALFDTAREQGTEHLEQYRERAADEIENLARTASSAAEGMQDKDTLGLSHYITDVADGLGNFAGSLRGKSADELLQQVGRLARDNPALFLTGSIALGFGLSRFMRASAPDIERTPSTDNSESGADTRTDDSRTDDFDPRIAADEELAVRPPHEGDAVRSPYLSPASAPETGSGSSSQAGSDVDSGIQPSGAELGSFADQGAGFSSDTTPGSPSTDKPAMKGEL